MFLVWLFASVCWNLLQLIMRGSTYHKFFLPCVPLLIGLAVLAAYLTQRWFPRDMPFFWLVYLFWLVPNIRKNWDIRILENHPIYRADPTPECRAFIELSLRLTKVFYILSHLTFASAFFLSFYLVFSS